MIGIQARSGSKRLPGKSLEYIEDLSMIDWCLAASKMSAGFINYKKDTLGLQISVCLLIPNEDPIKESMIGQSFIIEGPEDNVLERYRLATKQLNPDYIVRLTGDCPLLPPTLITKHILSAVQKELDYCSNTFDEMRSMPDGYDVEVISRRLMEWLFTAAQTREEKEHVTILAKSAPPPWAKYGVIIGHNDFSNIKFSVDTKEELEFVRANKASISQKIERAKSRKYLIFRF
jgi:spore coat polysaccharide biosynthesis protein SpsF (cytidylyltransferase family)